ncbi:MAG TPA: amidohydrolase family protein [Candidatus Binataceae bacterium]|nr:amidohydrolase family protein [Candidatus Binataceae bacterium]
MMEPGDLWVERLDRKFKDLAPRVITHDKQSQPIFSAPGMAPYPVAVAFAAGRSGKEMQDFVDQATEDQAQRYRDPALRIVDQDRDGVSAEVLYTSLGMSLFGLEDANLQTACFRAYNDWVGEFCSHDPKRFVGIALISLADVEQGAQELRRVAKAGLKGAMIWGAAPPDKPFWHSVYDPFWTAAQELAMPLSLHVITGAPGTSGRKGGGEKSAVKLKGATRVTRYMKLPLDAQASFTDMILGGVLMRFPRLKLVSAENDSGWIAHYMYRLDHAFEKFGVFIESKLDLKPSDYVRRQLWATFQDDPIGPLTWQYFGEDRFMWASDYPHTDSTFPHSREVIERDFASIPEAVKRKIVCENAAALYQVALD